MSEERCMSCDGVVGECPCGTSQSLDDKVAREVMGWIMAPLKTGRFEEDWFDEDCTTCAQVSRREWSPSTRIDHAWMVVERMRKLGWKDKHYSGYRHHSWTFFKGNNVFCMEPRPGSDPEAICQAALATVRSRVQ